MCIYNAEQLLCRCRGLGMAGQTSHAYLDADESGASLLGEAIFMHMWIRQPLTMEDWVFDFCCQGVGLARYVLRSSTSNSCDPEFISPAMAL
jgi:hypothetical protein